MPLFICRSPGNAPVPQYTVEDSAFPEHLCHGKHAPCSCPGQESPPSQHKKPFNCFEYSLFYLCFPTQHVGFPAAAQRAPMSLSSSQSRKDELGAASNLSIRYLAAFSLPLVAGKTSAWPRLNAQISPSGIPFIAALTSSSVLLPYALSLATHAAVVQTS